jgi:hypothetical protein
VGSTLGVQSQIWKVLFVVQKITSVGTVMKVEPPAGSQSVDLLLGASGDGRLDLLGLSSVTGENRSLVVNIVSNRVSVFRIFRVSVRLDSEMSRRWRMASSIIWIHLRLVVPVGLSCTSLGILFVLLGGNVFWSGIGQVCIIVAGVFGVLATALRLILTPREYPRMHDSGKVLLRRVPIEFAQRVIEQNPGNATIVKSG